MPADSTPVALRFRDAGSGAPIVILHGLFGSGRNWQTVAERLRSHYRVITVDLRNHGDSPHADAMSYAGMAADVLAMLDSLRLTTCTLLGHSMGGKVAMTMALTAPERVERLVAVDIAPVSYAERFSPLVDSMLALPVETLRNRAEASRCLEAAEPDAGVRSFLLHNLVARDGGYAWRINLPAIRAALGEIRAFPETSGHYDGPTLFLRGEHSNAVLDEHTDRIRSHFKHASIQTIAGAGHWPHTETPDAFLAALLDFLRATNAR